jgi:NADH-quinone oxidoreductase subunit M
MTDLTLTVLIPLVGAILVLLAPRGERTSRPIGIGVALVSLGQSLLVLRAFDKSDGAFQMVVDRPWVSSLGIHFHLGVDGISLWLVLLTTLMVFLTLLSPQAMGLHKTRTREFVVAMLVLETGMLGTFLAIDLFAFYVFWELMLIPMYFIIGIWGGERRLYAAIKFVIFTLAGSLLMLAAIVYL